MIAATKSVADICEQIGVDSLAYLSWGGMLEMTQEDTNGFCSACFTGDYPITIPDDLKGSKLMLEQVRG